MIQKRRFWCHYRNLQVVGKKKTITIAVSVSYTSRKSRWYNSLAILLMKNVDGGCFKKGKHTSNALQRILHTIFKS
jgi:hypothetical protein